MVSSLIWGRYLVSRVISDDSSEIIENGALFQRDGEIVEVGAYSDLKSKYSPDEEVGSSDFLVIPGLVNAHHHVGLTPFQLGVHDEPLEIWALARRANRDVDPYLDTLYCAIQMIESGITTVMHNHALSRLPMGVSLYESSSRAVDAYEDSGMRVAYSVSHRDQNSLIYEEDEDFIATLPEDLAEQVRDSQAERVVGLEDYLSLCAELYERKQSDRTRIFISPHNVHTCSPTMLREIKEFGQRNSTGIHIHLHETIYQKMYGVRHWGTTPAAHLYDIGFLGPEVSCAHGVWLTESDMEVLAETGTVVCHNPSSNLRLKSGIAPLNTMLAKGVTVAIGIDEAGINDDNDMLQEMRLAQKLHRVPGVASPFPTSHQILHLATVNGAKATFFGNEVGTIEPGKRADVVLVGLERITEPYLDPDTNMVDALVYRGKDIDVDTVVVDGRVLMKDRKILHLDKEEVIGRLKESLNVPLKPYEVERAEIGRRLVPYGRQFLAARTLEVGTPHYYYNERK